MEMKNIEICLTFVVVDVGSPLEQLTFVLNIFDTNLYV